MKAIDLDDIYNAGLLATFQEHVDEEGLKQGILRAGSTGFINEQGEFLGSSNSCPRLLLLRSLGIDKTSVEKMIEDDLMFGAGRSNEVEWVNTLKAGVKAKGFGIDVLREEEFPIAWSLDNGVKVTGRPDIILRGKQSGKPLLGVELKQIVALSSAVKVLIEPKFSHLLQAAHYSYILGKIPYELWYTNRSIWPIADISSEWLLKDFLAVIKPDSPFVEKVTKQGQDLIGKLKTYRKGYKLIWRKNDKGQDSLEYHGIGESLSQVTCITWDGIKKYFEFVSEMIKTNELGGFPQEVDSTGFDKKSFSSCKYCELHHICCGRKKAKTVEEFVCQVKGEIVDL